MELTKKKYRYKDIAILVRANDHSQPFVRSLLRHNIPYQFLGPGRLFQQEEIKDLIAYLKVLYNFEDSVSLYRVLLLPIFQLETRDVAAVLNFARRKNYTLFEALEKITDKKNPGENSIILTNAVLEKVTSITGMIKRHLNRVSKESAGQILYYFLKDSGLLENFLKTGSTDVKAQQNIAKFFDKLKTYEAEHEDASVTAVVEWIDLSMQMGESPLSSDIDWSENNAVNILTIHSSKGLEFPIVFLVNLVSGRFPVRERKEQIPIPQPLIKEILPIGDFHLQEERRLFYVGLTRAKDQLFLTASHFYGEGKRERKISPFVIETLGENFVLEKIKKTSEIKPGIQTSLLDWMEESKISKNEAVFASSKKQTLNPINYISYSQLQTFEICPLHYKLKYILKVPAVVTSSQSFGTSIHSALRDFYTAFLQGQSIPKKRILDFLKTNWINEGYQSKTHEIHAFDKAQNILTDYLNDYFDPKTTSPIALEVPFQFSIKNPKLRPESLKIGGRIDRVDKLANNKIEILDYKTGSNVPEEKELAENIQLTIYGLAAIYTNTPPFGKKPEDIVLALYYLEEDKKLTTVRNYEQLKACEELIFQKVEEIENSDFTCSRHMLCQNCEYKMLCQT